MQTMDSKSVFKSSMIVLLFVIVLCADGCEVGFSNTNNGIRSILREYLADDAVRLVDYTLKVRGLSENFWRSKGGTEWFQPWKWYRAKGSNSERLLLLFHYYYGLLKPYLGIGTETLDLRLEVNDSACLRQLDGLEIEYKLRQFLYYDLKNETERQATTFNDQDIHVCSMHVGEYDGWGRLLYRCCYRNDDGDEWCYDISDDGWVWTLRAFVIIVSILLFLYFPKLIPKGYYVYSFVYYPPDGKSFNLLLTTKAEKYKGLPNTTVLPASKWKKMRKLSAQAGILQPDVVHNVKVKRVSFEVVMDRLLSETSHPVSAFRTVFDSLVRCKVRHADPLEDCCNTSVCGELCCTGCPVWHAWLRALRTILVLALMAVPALPILYAISGENLEYQELARVYDERGLLQSYNFYPGSVFGKVLVGILAFLYIVHGILVVADGCHDQNLARAYTELLQVTEFRARLSDRMNHSQSIIRRSVWPIKRFGVLAIPVGLILLALLPLILLVYIIFTSPVPKLIAHIFQLMCGKVANRHRKTKDEMSKCRLLESVLFVITLIGVFAVLTLSLNFLVHVAVILLVSLIVDISFVMKFLPVIVLLLVYVRDSFKVVNDTYASHHSIVLRHVLGVEADDVKREADKDWEQQENKIFKIVPASAADPKGMTGKDEEQYKKKKLFFIKNGDVRMRTRSLVLFLDKDDIPYIPKKFLFHTVTMACPGSPGLISEAFIRAAGRFMRTVVFLMFIMLVVLAYADTYYISPTSQFFAILLTGTIPLLLRYFFLNPGSVTKVDTSTLRFQTQMDDKIESYVQSWVVEDIEVDKVTLRKEHDQHYSEKTEYQDYGLDFTPPDKDAVKAMVDREDSERERTYGRPQLNGGQAGNKQVAPVPQEKTPPLQRQQTRTKMWTPNPPPGYGNYMMTDDLADMGADAGENFSHDFSSHYQTFTDPTLEKDSGYQTETKTQKSSTSEFAPPKRSDPLDTKLNGSVPGNVSFNVFKPSMSGTLIDGLKASKDSTHGSPRIDLVLDIRGEKTEKVSNAEFEEKVEGSKRLPSLHWKRRSNLVRDSEPKERNITNFWEYGV